MSKNDRQSGPEILKATCQGEAVVASEELLPLVYSELRALAQVMTAKLPPGQTLQATALVHEAYARLVNKESWEGRTHFFNAVGQAMRHILIDNARRRNALKHGHGHVRVDLDPALAVSQPFLNDTEILALDDALVDLEKLEKRWFEVVKLRFFAGLTIDDAAEALGVSVATTRRDWRSAKAWLKKRLTDSTDNHAGNPSHE